MRSDEAQLHAEKRVYCRPSLHAGARREACLRARRGQERSRAGEIVVPPRTRSRIYAPRPACMRSPRRSTPHRYRVAPVREYTADEWCDTLLRGWYGGATVTERQGPMPPPPPLPPPLPTTAPTSGKAEPSGGSSSGGGGGDGSGWVAAARGAALSTARILVSPLEGFVIALAFLAVDGAHDGAHGKSAPRSAVVSAAVDEPPVLTTALTTARLPAGWQCGYDSSTGRPY